MGVMQAPFVMLSDCRFLLLFNRLDFFVLHLPLGLPCFLNSERFLGIPRIVAFFLILHKILFHV